MDNKSQARMILESYDEIQIENEIFDDVFMISIFQKQFLFWGPSKDDSSSRPSVYLFNDTGMDCPHIMLSETEISSKGDLPIGTYRLICLYEQESIVNSIISFEEKVIDALDRLIELLSMNEHEKELEFQKEFMFYWNSQSKDELNYHIYLKQENTFSKLNVYFGKGCVRLIEDNLALSDIDSRTKNKREWNQHVENDSFFIPIIDSREIIPPHRGYDWTIHDIINIVYSNQIEHISLNTFQQIKKEVPKTKDLIITFGMQTSSSYVTFALKVFCNNHAGHSLLEILINDIISVEPLKTRRKDYLYLNKQIGNDIILRNKKIVLVGAGSLGSYIAFELVKNGISEIRLYDNDILEDENILRWAYGGFGKGSNKAATISGLLNLLHPEIRVESIEKRIDDKDFPDLVSNFDMIILSIGSSDEQLKFNRKLKSMQCPIPVVYVWLEAGGENSHILVVDYDQKGCYECLFTDEEGKFVNNRGRKNSDEVFSNYTIHNGCGGTRAAYGTAILLRTTAALLDIIGNIVSKELNRNTLFDITHDRVAVSDTKFPERKCLCCGDRKE